MYNVQYTPQCTLCCVQILLDYYLSARCPNYQLIPGNRHSVHLDSKNINQLINFFINSSNDSEKDSAGWCGPTRHPLRISGGGVANPWKKSCIRR